MNPHILVVEDEPALQFLIATHLRRQGYAVTTTGDVQAAQQALQSALPSLILLDWMLPGVSGFEFLRRLRMDERTRAVPVIMLTARAEERDKVAGLDAGADDYLAKPFSPRELVARIAAVLRRSERSREAEVLEAGGLRLDRASHRVTAGERPVHLGPSEFRMLEYLMANAERVHSRARLLDALWGHDAAIDERTVDVHIRRLRAALEPSGHDRLIQTVRGSGYRFSTEVAA
ncbi:MAG: phosphate regulon transcriptional regulator PhoB [Rhodocyclaceae bacterium]|nr:phosphate regulon transcriptional regulator PhoB [Rhodocyclaceae bacterium]